jgi:hypothetical protein
VDTASLRSRHGFGQTGRSEVSAAADLGVTAATDLDFDAAADPDVSAAADLDVSAATDLDFDAAADPDVSAARDLDFTQQRTWVSAALDLIDLPRRVPATSSP